MKTLTIIFVVSLMETQTNTQSSPEYFEYNTDCGTECIDAQDSCTISEPEKFVFSRKCYTEDSECMTQASPMVVCLTKQGKPLGGMLIWNDYKEKFYPDTHKSNNYLHILINTVTFLVGTIVGCMTQPCLCGYIKRRRDNYIQIPSSSDVYQSTVEPVAYDGRDDGTNRSATE